MFALVFSRASRHVAKRWSFRRAAAALPRAWHLLSLDAPTVAAVWCAEFLALDGAHLSQRAARWPVLFLSLATWLCYIGDRTLDARDPRSGAPLRDRHRFYGALWSSQRLLLLTPACIAVVICGATALCGLASSLLRAYVLLTVAALVYFAFVHWGAARGSRVVAKEATVAAIFALGCALPAWDATHAWRLVPLAVMFGLVCWLNCVAIERWEGRGSVPTGAHGSTRWAARHLRALLETGAGCSIAVALLTRRLGGSASPAACLALAFVLLSLLERLRSRLSPEALRILADVALLTPAVAWGLARLYR